ncbi:hypothetical protein [Paenibacillus contaminans]|uniref:hypothetical protein n=1 Tax=Paenibacillus contaminans TaxID=450362 RepID=UPI0011BF6BBC|nr:hypothetical protein [Paenibacillus contaminans]
MELSIDVVLFLVCALSCCAWIAGPKAVRIWGAALQVTSLLPLRADWRAARPRLPIRMLRARRKLPRAFRETAGGDEPASGMGKFRYEYPSIIPGGMSHGILIGARAAADRSRTAFAAHVFVSSIA